MATKKDSIVVRFLGDDSGFQRVAKRVGSTTAKLTKSIQGFGRVIGGVFTAGTGGLVANVRAMAIEFDAIAKTATKLGTTTEELSKLHYAGELTGVAANKMDMALQRMTRRLAEAAKGTGAAKDAIKELGLDAQKLANMAPEEAFKEIADAMQGVESQSEKVRLAFKFFDSEGVALVNTMARGRAGIEQYGQELEDLGGVIDSEAAAAAENFNDNLTRMDVQFAALSRTIGNDFLPVMNESLQFWNALAQGETLDMAIARMEDAIVSVNPLLTQLNVEIRDTKKTLRDLAADKEGALGFLVPDYAFDNAERKLKDLERKKTTIMLQEDERRTKRRESRARQQGKRIEEQKIKGEEDARKAAAKEKAVSTDDRLTVLRQAIGRYDRGEIDAIELGELTGQYAEGTLKQGAYGTSGNLSKAGQAISTPLETQAIVSNAFVSDIERAVQMAMEGRTYRMKVVPELVGMEGVEVSSRDTADKEGVHR